MGVWIRFVACLIKNLLNLINILRLDWKNYQMLTTSKIKWFNPNCCELPTNDLFEVPIEDKIRLDEKRLHVATSTMFQVKITLCKEFPMCMIKNKVLKERSQRVVLIQWFDPPPEVSLRYVIGCFEREEISRSLFLLVYTHP